MDDQAKELKRIGGEIERLVDIVGKVANAQTAISLYDKMSQELKGWDGRERRSSNPFCMSHESLVKDVGELKISMAVVKDTVIGMKGTKALIVTTLITVILAALGVASMWGSTSNQVGVNTARINSLEDLHPRSSK